MKSRFVIILSVISIIGFILLIPAFRSSLKNFVTSSSQKSSSGSLIAIPSANLKENLRALFSKLELQETDYVFRVHSDSSLEIRASVPRGKPLEWVVWEVSKAISGTPYRIDDCIQKAEGSCKIYFKSHNKQHKPVSLLITRSNRYFSTTAKIAILIKEFEFKADQTTIEFLSFPQPLTFGILPLQPGASRTAEFAKEHEKELLVMLPMEPLPRDSDLRSSQIMIHFAENRIKDLYSQALQNISGISGISNYYGSRVLQDSRVMKTILSETKKRGLYFIDTDVTAKSLAKKASEDINVAFMTVDSKIGNKESAEQIRSKLTRQAIVAQKTGKALILVPACSVFLKILNEELPKLADNGIKLVYVSDLFPRRN